MARETSGEGAASAHGSRYGSAGYRDGLSVRLAARRGELIGPTCGHAPRHLQANIVILPAGLASDFARYCRLNPKPCPVLAIGDEGSFSLPTLADDLDVRSDLPRYRVWRKGECVDEVENINALWRDDLVVFAIGCSFTFEQGLIDAGIRLRHIDCGLNVAMYRSSIETVPAGDFGGPMVVSMRPMLAADAIRAIQISARFPAAHGAPVHFGDPALIGIHDLATPDYGDAVELHENEVPVFWACGVTPQAAILRARPDFCITHAPGAMLVTDRLDADSLCL